MTQDDMTIQELRREIQRLKDKNAELEKQRKIDMSQLAYYRRQIDFLMDSEREADHDKRQR